MKKIKEKSILIILGIILLMYIILALSMILSPIIIGIVSFKISLGYLWLELFALPISIINIRYIYQVIKFLK